MDEHAAPVHADPEHAGDAHAAPERTAPGRPGRRAVVRALAAVLVALAAAALAWWRLGPVTRATTWAEDGGVFLREQLAYGAGGTLLRPYAGYVHLVPRLLVDLAVHRPVEQYALTLSASACAVVGVVAASIFLLSRDVVRPWPFRLVLAAVPVVLPLAPVEISGNVANLHSYAMALVPWLFSYRARTWWGAGVVAVLTLAATLTELQTVLFLPLLALAWWPARDVTGRRVVPGARDRLLALPVTVAAVLGCSLQVLAALTTERLSRPGTPSVGDVVRGYMLLPFGGLWDRDVAAVGAAVARHGWWVVLLPAAGIAVAVLAAVLVTGWRTRWTLVALLLGSAGVWAAALVANRSANGRWGSIAGPALAAIGPNRYAAAAGMLLLSAVVVAAAALAGDRWNRQGEGDPTGSRRRRPTRTGGAVRVLRVGLGWCLVALVVTTAVANAAPARTNRSDGPEWAPQVASSVGVCRADPAAVLEVRTAPWSAQVPCALVLRNR